MRSMGRAACAGDFWPKSVLKARNGFYSGRRGRRRGLQGPFWGQKARFRGLFPGPNGRFVRFQAGEVKLRIGVSRMR